jgi:hypothetical protein
LDVENSVALVGLSEPDELNANPRPAYEKLLDYEGIAWVEAAGRRTRHDG